MALVQQMVQSLTNWKRSLRILWRKTILFLHLCFSFLLRNYNHRERHTGIPQPAYYNSWEDISLRRTVLGMSWLHDLEPNLNSIDAFETNYNNFQYDMIVKAYMPTKLTAMESVNLKRTWINSYWNPWNSGREDKNLRLLKSDTLFGDLMSNTQNIYNILRVEKKSTIHKKVEIFFGNLLENNRKKILKGKSVEAKMRAIDYLLQTNNLYYLDYPELRAVENENSTRQKIGGQKYHNSFKTISGEDTQAYLSIPFAIFAEVEGYYEEGITHLVCLGSVFNETAEKENSQQVTENQIFHPFSEEAIDRDRWEMAKIHMACCDTNDFTIRVHLGLLHYATSIYTCAFANIVRDHPELKWIKTYFIDLFSQGLLQVDFNANLTLVDHKDPMAEKIFYIRRQQAVSLISQSNSQFNVLNFSSQALGRNSYQSDSVKISEAYYEKLKLFVDFVVCKNRRSISSPSRIYAALLKQLRDKTGKFDSLPEFIVEDDTSRTLCNIMTNLAYMWVVFHGQTFSLVSCSCPFYLVPSVVRKPLSELPRDSEPLTDEQKQEWLPPMDIIKDNMTLHKVVTFRLPEDSLLSRWNHLPIDHDVWDKFLKKKRPELLEMNQEMSPTNFGDFWNDLALTLEEINYSRLKKGLYVLHWYQPNQMPSSLNI